MRKTLDEKLNAGRVRVGSWASDDSFGSTGMFAVAGPCGTTLRIIACQADHDPEGWDHVSVSCEQRCPNWEEMCWIKDQFFTDDEIAIQFHPAKKDHINIHPFVLHLWRHKTLKFPMPPKIAV